MIDIQLLETALDPAKCAASIAHPAAGGSVVFIGTVRNKTAGREVIRLEFEAYAPMAIAEMHKIAVSAMEKWQALAIAVHHRVGILDIGEIPVIIAVSTPHREAAFQACKYCIDTLKETVPIWKKEIFNDGSSWVAAHP
jgi:molybdopterin synthase catalytic subunit